jgi:hypothetical protein
MEAAGSSETLVQSTKLHDITPQKTVDFDTASETQILFYFVIVIADDTRRSFYTDSKKPRHWTTPLES